MHLSDHEARHIFWKIGFEVVFEDLRGCDGTYYFRMWAKRENFGVAIMQRIGEGKIKLYVNDGDIPNPDIVWVDAPPFNGACKIYLDNVKELKSLLHRFAQGEFKGKMRRWAEEKEHF